MKHNPHRDRVRRKCAAMRAAKERRRLEQAAAAVEVGVVQFSGPAFGGPHVLRALHRDGDGHLLVEIDGRAHRPRTLRGLVRVLARRLWRIQAPVPQSAIRNPQFPGGHYA